MDVSTCLVTGGIPDDWTPHNLVWLAATHRRLGKDDLPQPKGSPPGRPEWHRRWATFCEDLLESYRVYNH